MIVGIQESFIDYPDNICVMLFTRACSWDCPGCYNKANLSSAEPIEWRDVMDYLDSTRDLTSCVTISGGEPTEDPDIFSMVSSLHQSGYSLKLDTNGSSPDVLSRLLPYLSVVAMDVKTSLNPDRYSEFTGPSGGDSIPDVERSLHMLSEWCVEDPMGHTLILRTTLFNDRVDVDGIRAYLDEHGISYTDYVVQDDVRNDRGR